MKYLLDTCTISDLVHGIGDVTRHFQAVPRDELAFSCISRMELEYGLALAPRRAKALTDALDQFTRGMWSLPFCEQDAIDAGRLRAILRQQGRPIGPYDVQIAGCALARGLILVTSNTREFGRVHGLRIENWR